MNTCLIVLGAWIAFDGVVSMILYEKQSWTEQAIRVIRTGVGIAVAYLGWTL